MICCHSLLNLRTNKRYLYQALKIVYKTSMSIGFWQIAVVVVLVVLLFGRGKISSLMGDVAKGIKSFRKGMSDKSDQTNTTSSNTTSSNEASNETSSEDSKTDKN